MSCRAYVSQKNKLNPFENSIGYMIVDVYAMYGKIIYKTEKRWKV